MGNFWAIEDAPPLPAPPHPATPVTAFLPAVGRVTRVWKGVKGWWGEGG